MGMNRWEQKVVAGKVVWSIIKERNTMEEQAIIDMIEELISHHKSILQFIDDSINHFTAVKDTVMDHVEALEARISGLKEPVQSVVNDVVEVADAVDPTPTSATDTAPTTNSTTVDTTEASDATPLVVGSDPSADSPIGTTVPENPSVTNSTPPSPGS